jgi:hypothetical protein
MAAVVGPMAAAAAGGGAGGAMVGAVAASASTNATVSTINNRGDLGAVFKDVTSSDAMKGYVISGATAGLTAAYFGDWTGTQTNTLTGKITTPGLLNTWSGVGKFAANQTLQSGTSMLLSKALGQGGSASDALKNALFNTLAAASFNLVGNYTEGLIADGSAPKIAIHAMVGGLLAEATGGDFKTGALAAGANEALVTHLNTLVKGNDELLTMSSQIVGVLAAAGQKDADAAKLEKGKWIAQNLTQYNFLEHLPPGLSEYGSAATSLAQDMQQKGFTDDQIAKAQLELARGQGFEGVQPANEFVKAWTYFMAGELTGAGLAAVIGRLVLGGGAKAVGATEVPATSAIARVGLREDLAAQAGIPRNMVEAPANVWGKSIDDIQQAFKMDGAKLTYVPPKIGTSGNAQAYKVEGGTTGIKEIQYSPSTVDASVKSTHVGEYYKITYFDGSKAKIIDPVIYRPTFQGPSKPIYDANTTYLNPQGQKVKFNPVTNAWISE